MGRNITLEELKDMERVCRLIIETLESNRDYSTPTKHFVLSIPKNRIEQYAIKLCDEVLSDMIPVLKKRKKTLRRILKKQQKENIKRYG